MQVGESSDRPSRRCQEFTNMEQVDKVVSRELRETKTKSTGIEVQSDRDGTDMLTVSKAIISHDGTLQ